MSDMIVLRDHSEPCKHGKLTSHMGGDRWEGMDPYDSANEMAKTCPGGKKITLQPEWRCLQGEAYGGPCIPEEWADMSPNSDWMNYPLRHHECGYVWMEVADE